MDDHDHNNQNQKVARVQCAELAGRPAGVTGASKGSGRQIACELAGGGANVLVHGNSGVDAANQLAAWVRSQDRQSHVVLCDLSEPSQQDRLIHEAWVWRGGVDIWVNNAGVDVLTGPLARDSFEEKMDRLWRVD